MTASIALIGFGEAGMAFARGWSGSAKPRLRAFDIKFASADKAVAEAKRADMHDASVECCDDLAACLDGVDAVFSLVTASRATDAAIAAARHLRPDTFYFDCNSCAPSAKRMSFGHVEASGARYVDVAVIAPVHPLLHRTPLLTSGPHAQPASSFLAALDMSAALINDQIGSASTIKMIRSVMMKGLEALMLECVLAARKEGVDAQVLDSLGQTFPDFDWYGRAGYMLERAMVHGRRRAEEMRDVASTIDEIGIGPGSLMATATALWEQQVGDLELGAAAATMPTDYRGLADILIERLAARA